MAVTGHSAHDQCMHDVNEWTDNWHIKLKDLQVVLLRGQMHQQYVHFVILSMVPTFVFSVAPVQP